MSEIRFPKAIRISDPLIKSVLFEDDVYYTCLVVGDIGFEILSPSEEAVEEFTQPLILKPSSEDNQPDLRTIVIRRHIEGEAEGVHLPDTDLLLRIGPWQNLVEDQPVVIELDIDPKISAGHRHVFTFASLDSSDKIEITGQQSKINSKLYDGREPELIRLNSVLEPNRMLVTNRSEERQGIGSYIQMSEIDRILDKMGSPLFGQIIDTGVSSPATIKPHSYGKEQYALVITTADSGQSQYKITGHVRVR